VNHAQRLDYCQELVHGAQYQYSVRVMKGVENMETIDLIDEAIQKGRFVSDRQMSLAMGLSGSAVSNYRQGLSKPDNQAMNELARITGRNFNEVVAIIESERATNQSKKEYWKDVLKKMGGTAAGFVFSNALFLEGVNNVTHCILCKIRGYLCTDLKYQLAC